MTRAQKISLFEKLFSGKIKKDEFIYEIQMARNGEAEKKAVAKKLNLSEDFSLSDMTDEQLETAIQKFNTIG